VLIEPIFPFFHRSMSCQADSTGKNTVEFAGFDQKETSRRNLSPTKMALKSGAGLENPGSRWTTVTKLVYLLAIVIVADRLLFCWEMGLDAKQEWNVGRDLGFWLTICAFVLIHWLSNSAAVRSSFKGQSSKAAKELAANENEEKDSDEDLDSSPRKRSTRPASTATGRTSKFSAGVSVSNSLESLIQKKNQAIYNAAWGGNCEEAMQLLKEMQNEGLQPEATTYNLILRGFAKKGNVHGAERLLMQMESAGVQGTICSYNTVLDACSKAGNAEACEKWLSRMLRHGPQVNVISFATTIYAWAKRGDEAKARCWFDRMTEANIEPDTVCYNSMIHACSITGNPEMAEQWMQEMQDRRIVPTVMTFTTLIDGCAKAGDLSRAEKWFNEMQEHGIEPNLFTYCAMIDGCAKAANLARAEFWHDRMVEKGLRPNMHIISAIINACAKECDVDAAEKWLSRLEQEGSCDVVAYTSVIDACGKAGDPERALKIFQRMEASGLKPHIVAYSALAKPFAYKGDWQKVEGFAEDMRRNGIMPNEYFLYAQLVAYASARPRQVQRAEACFLEAAKQGVKLNDHVTSALGRAIGRGRSLQLLEDVRAALAQRGNSSQRSRKMVLQ